MRICESNSPECSGINPCPYCYAFVFAKVLPNTIRAGGLASTRELAEAALKAYDETWRKALEARVEEKKASNPVEPFTTPLLIEFLNFKEARRKFLAQKAEEQRQMEDPSSSGEARRKFVAQKTDEQRQLDVAVPTNVESEKANGHGAKGNRPNRGDVKRIAEKQAKESLAPGKSHSATAGNSNDSGVNPASGGTSPTNDGTRRH